MDADGTPGNTLAGEFAELQPGSPEHSNGVRIIAGTAFKNERDILRRPIRVTLLRDNAERPELLLFSLKGSPSRGWIAYQVQALWGNGPRMYRIFGVAAERTPPRKDREALAEIASGLFGGELQ